MLHTALAAAAAVVALAFAMCTFERWLVRHRRHELAWSVALAMFCLGSAALAAGAALGWNGVTFRLFFLFGAIANVPFLALGTVYLLAGRRPGDLAAVGVGVFAAFSAGVVAVAPFTAPLPASELAQGSEVFGPLPRILAAVASGGGALVVLAGALWSAARVRAPRLVLANAVIAAGVVVSGASGLLNSVLDDMTGFSVTLVAGITLLFAGFLLATTEKRGPLAVPAAPLALELAGHHQELHQRGAEDQGQQQDEDDGRPPPHDAASRVTASPGRSLSSSAADRRSSATETRP
ncbi:MAG: hypothetical protein M3P85_14925 [Actinomycetota bacterium]|jgi:hypothetical protein|nr:hypothetical protein [Actinomycetota bacterium]